MHGLTASLDEARALAAALEARPPPARVAICPPATLINRMAEALAGLPILIGGQDCRPEPAGAFTGDLSAEMLIDAGASLVILGHSERRARHGESNALVAAKAKGALRAGLEPIVCVGEGLDQRRAGAAIGVVEAQLRGSLPIELAAAPFAIAYEPVWAIGSGLIPGLDEIAAVHGAIRDVLIALFGEVGGTVPILYGGSVKPSNAKAILGVKNVGGALVGGASLVAAEFASIIEAI
jgi:triosephosphate isomerase